MIGENLNFIKASFDGCRLVTAWTDNHQRFEFEAITQDEYDEIMTVDNCEDYLRHATSDFPVGCQNYREWAESIFTSHDEDILIDDYCCEYWEKICQLAEIDIDEYPYSDFKDCQRE